MTTAATADYLPISQLNKFVFCPRRFYYEFVLGEWQDNIYTLRGTYRHEKAHTPGREKRNENISTRSVSVFSDRLRILGKMDVLEERAGVMIPVEYKSGEAREGGPWLNDAVQLCALALCLEERRGERIASGALFTFEDRARVAVPFDEKLRRETEAVIAAAHEVAASEQIPPPLYSPRCEGCSLKPLCLPQEVTRMQHRPDSQLLQLTQRALQEE